jgi:predicted metalloprotease with PDZ domain
MPVMLLSLALHAEPTVEYRVTLADPAARRIEVVAEVRGLEAGDLRLEMPRGFTYLEPRRPLLDGPIRARVAGAEVAVDARGTHSWLARTGGADEVELAYSVPLEHRALPEIGERDAYEHPYVEHDHGLLTGASMFLVPAPAADATVRFEVPESWPVRCPWNETSPGVFAPTSMHALLDGMVALGHWRPRELAVGGARVTTLFAPSEASLEALAGPAIDAIVGHELELFGVRPFERYLFLFTPSDVRGFAGAAKQGAMVLTAMAEMPREELAPGIAHLVAHELFHTWASSRYDAPDELRFLSEGFTDYFAHVVAARVGATAPERVAETLGESVRLYERAARATGLSLVEAGGPAFFRSQDAYQQIYSGGLLVAAACEVALRRVDEPTDLVAFLRELNNDPRWSRAKAPALGDVVALLARRAGQGFAERVRELVQRRGAVDFVAELAQLGCVVERSSVPASTELRARVEGTKVVDIDPESALYELGLRPGDVVLEANGVTPTSRAETFRAFDAPRDGRVRARLRRGSGEVAIDQPIPMTTQVSFEAQSWR